MEIVTFDPKTMRYWYRVTKLLGEQTPGVKVGTILLEDTFHGDEWCQPILDTDKLTIVGGWNAEHIKPEDRPPEIVKALQTQRDLVRGVDHTIDMEAMAKKMSKQLDVFKETKPIGNRAERRKRKKRG